MSLNQPSVTLNYAANLFSGNSVSTSDHVEAETIRNRGEMVFIPPFGVPASMQQINRQLHAMPGYSDGDTVLTDSQFVKQPLHTYSSEQNPLYNGLSLSLGSRVPSLVQGPSNINQYTDSSFSSPLSLHAVHSQAQVSQVNGLKNVEYLSFDLAGETRDTVNYGAVNGVQLLTSPKEIHSMSSLCEATGITRTFWNSKYLSAARDLLNEVVSVHRALEKPEKCQDFNSLGRDGSIGTDVKGGLMSSEPYELTTNASSELSPSERRDLQNKLTKLLSMLDEVDTRYKHYNHQMQVLVSSFEMVVGRGAAQPYTTLARRTISRQFRCLRDAIKRHIQVTQKVLGEQDVTSHGQGVLSRLRFVDQQLRQQKALQQFGMTGQSWRPQRGLPENAVSVLRSWLFEHFLHPYPKDSEKIILAKQTGLTRSQVANWFINARVRLWKPMIEEMYKEEFGDAEAEPKTSPEHAAAAQEKSSYDDRDEEHQGSLMSSSVNGNHMAQSSEFMTDVISSSEWNVHEAKLSYQAGPYRDNELHFGRIELHHKKLLNVADNRIFSDETVSREKTGCGIVEAAGDRHDVSTSSNAIGNQVSLALGLQHCEKNPQPISGGTQPSEDGTTASSMGLNKLEYRYMDPVNQQHRFSNPHLFSDFVA
ncbi:BEL1-like homeodomain protein 3 [Olea europaea var. sylvestris]|uniref:BEL1-like homeodomain 3 n=1 Tax=Olea europaea subsp. europaea TaxID=158383 RepID=A0A8S0ULS4_OLEEU|nr:BEL1-like homeodomain protein 3 [Olea europaea var. sylvestris]CAA3019501.1 BEL1-like homeodomain 3 [Olea europaea subsp. europaea]